MDAHMPDLDDTMERYRAQADEMIAIAAKTPIPIIDAKPSQIVAGAHGFLEVQRAIP